MSTISSADKQYLNNALRLQNNGWIIRFTEEDFIQLFEEEGIDINNKKYLISGTSKQNRFDKFLEIEDNKTVAILILRLASRFRNRELAGVSSIKFSESLEKIAKTLLIQPHKISFSTDNTAVSVDIHPDLYSHISSYIDAEDYFSAIQEAYKFVREKLKSITRKERATEVFGDNGLRDDFHKSLFGTEPLKGTPLYDSYRGYAHIYLAIQFLRNEQAHSLSKKIDRHLALHFITLASLAYTLISTKNP
ncbi:TIGR02391 family protein [Candidatus Avelusimicrobium sp.]|uniref:TIGR02391 family protein n=1 Tax=Candidatus Avelusimicrobium sp. TaxID=3048833 RepID=UPI003D7ECF00